MFNFKQRSNLMGAVIFSSVLLGVAIGGPAVFAGTCGTAANNNYSCDATQTSGSLCASGECIIGRGIPYTPCPANIQFSDSQEEWSCDPQTTCYARKQSGCVVGTCENPPMSWLHAVKCPDTESNFAGISQWTAVADLASCSLKCRFYCETGYSFENGMCVPSCSIKFTQSKTDSTEIFTATKGETKGFWSTISGFDKSLFDAYWACGKEGGGSVTKFAENALSNQSWTGNDWTFNYGGEEKCFIFFTQKGVSPSQTMLSQCGTKAVKVSIPGDIEPIGKPDGDVDIYDYNLLVTNFGQPGQNNPADINLDGKVDIYDYNLLVTNFGKTS